MYSTCPAGHEPYTKPLEVINIMELKARLIRLILLGLLMSCSNNNSSEKDYNESRELVPKPEGYKKDSMMLKEALVTKSNLINIDKGLTEKFGDYFISYHNGILSLCCFDDLAYPFGGNEKNDIEKYCINCTDSTYKIEINDRLHDRTKLTNNTSELTLFSYSHEDGYTEYYLEDSSYFNTPTVQLENGLQIGMSKKAVFDKYFTSSYDSIFSSLELIAVCPDERGELYTQYRFAEDTLNSIIFGYDMYKLKQYP